MLFVILPTRTDAGFGTEREAYALGLASRVVRLPEEALREGRVTQALSALLAAHDELHLLYAGTTVKAANERSIVRLNRTSFGELSPFARDVLDATPRREWLLPVLAELLRPPTSDAGSCDTGRPAVTIALCVHNDARYLPWAIYSVQRQTDPGWELLLVDDGSSPSQAPQLPRLPRDSRIRLLRLPLNRGKAHALNAALAHAAGDWLLELDADDWLPPDALAQLLSAARGHGLRPLRRAEPQAVVAGHRLWRETSRGELMPQPGWSRPASQEGGWHAFLEQGAVTAPRLFRTSALRSLGGWRTDDPSEGRLYEDQQMLARFLHASLPILPMDAPLYHRRLRRGSTSQTAKAKASYAAWKAEWRP
ncbi:glycosyltransferase family 2 protein [Gorillibacterium sp. CAU 1737]|uniref:glycosyltransferase family 2 protein n=1 Tax=Gorillibacterium sp. CAU 1737 TaxID=3140362 RepID=UPI003260D09F